MVPLKEVQALTNIGTLTTASVFFKGIPDASV
jgi:hypothetical protein